MHSLKLWPTHTSLFDSLFLTNDWNMSGSKTKSNWVHSMFWCHMNCFLWTQWAGDQPDIFTCIKTRLMPHQTIKCTQLYFCWNPLIFHSFLSQTQIWWWFDTASICLIALFFWCTICFGASICFLMHWNLLISVPVYKCDSNQNPPRPSDDRFALRGDAIYFQWPYCDPRATDDSMRHEPAPQKVAQPVKPTKTNRPTKQPVKPQKVA